MTGLPTPPDGWSLGIDASKIQGRLDIAALRAAGVSFAWFKAADGLHEVDDQYATSAAASVAAGLPFGAYDVLEPYGPAQAAAQAAHFCAIIKDTGAMLPPWLDFELAQGLTGLAALETAVAWCEAVEDALGRGVMVYTGPAFVKTLERYAGAAGSPVVAKLQQRPLVVAHYTGSVVRPPSVPPPWRTPDGDGWTIWQASGDGAATLPWNGRDVDVDYYRGPVADLVALGGA